MWDTSIRHDEESLQQIVWRIHCIQKFDDVDIGLHASEVDRLLRLCAENNNFRFQGDFYKQIDGVAMDGPLSTVLADIFMALIERALKAELNQTVCYRGYVDENLLICRIKREAEEITRLMSDVHPSIELSIEHENNNRLPFWMFCCIAL